MVDPIDQVKGVKTTLPVITQMLDVTSALYPHIVAKKDANASKKEMTESSKATGWLQWRNNALNLFGINYRYSDLVLEERDTKPQDRTEALARAYTGYEDFGTVCAGDHAPDAPGLVIGGKEMSLLRLFTSSHHTVLIFAECIKGDIHKVLESCTKYPKIVVVIIGK